MNYEPIPVSERVPAVDERCLYYFEPFNRWYAGRYVGLDDDIGILHGFAGDSGFNYGPEVTHWLPWPEPLR